jgi:hypothetical protein
VTTAGSKSCLPMGSDCIQTSDCCGCTGAKRPKGGPDSSCLTRVLIECLSKPSDMPSKHNLPEFGIIIWQPQPADGSNE